MKHLDLFKTGFPLTSDEDIRSLIGTTETQDTILPQARLLADLA